MGLFRRNKPLHEQLAEAAREELGRSSPESPNEPTGPAGARRIVVPAPRAEPPPAGEQPVYADRPAEPAAPIRAFPTPSWHPDGRAPTVEFPVESGLLGAPVSRPWDVVATAEAPLLAGDHLSFVAIDDGTIIVDDDQPDGAVAPLADAVEASIPPPYRAAAVRNHGQLWGVSAVRIVLVEIPELDGETAELITNSADTSLTVDGRAVRRRVQALERAGEAEGSSYVVRAARVDGDIWQVDALAL